MHGDRVREGTAVRAAVRAAVGAGLLGAALAGPLPGRAEAQADPARVGWAVEGEVAPGLEGWRLGLWSARAEERAGESGAWRAVDVLFRHAAAHATDGPGLWLVLERLAPPARGAPDAAPPAPDLTRTRLRCDGGDGLAQRPRALHAWPAGRSAERGLERWVLSFPPLPAGVSTLELVAPEAAGGERVLVRLERWPERVARARSELAGWRAHCRAIAHVSAIAPYLDHPAARALRARGDDVVVPLLAAELDPRAGADVLPHWVVLQALAGTAWGKAHGVPDHGDPAAARRVHAAWRRSGPFLPG